MKLSPPPRSQALSWASVDDEELHQCTDQPIAARLLARALSHSNLEEHLCKPRRYAAEGECPGTPVRGVAQAARRPACLLLASTPDVPFCAAATMAMAVILARRSAPEGVWSLGSHGTGCRELFRVLRGQRSWLPRLLVLLRPERQVGGGSYRCAQL